MRPAVRRAALVALASWGIHAAMPAQGAAPSVPSVLHEAAIVTPRALDAAMLGVVRAGDRLVAAGERGIVLYSDDAGRTWAQARVPVQVTLTALRFVDGRTGWAVGHLGVILRSDDAGATWRLQLDGVRAAAQALDAAQAGGDAETIAKARRLVEDGPDKAFFDVDFADARNGLAVGAYGMAFATDDGGTHWRPVSGRLSNARGAHLYGVRFSGERVVVVGEQGLLLRSDDRGSTFAALPSPYKGSLFGIVVAHDGTWLAFGLRGNAFRSTDAGVSWQRVDTELPLSISAGVDLGDSRLALLSQNGDVLASRDGGRSFRRQPAVEPTPATAMVATARGDLVIASLRGMRRRPAP